jgi:ribosomal protein S18 acetylase RimI-like enzyme
VVDRPATSSGARVSLRPARPEDEDFLRRVYGSTRADELAVTGWDDATKQAFVAQQFRAQRDYYMANYEGASFDLILVDGEPAGRLYVIRWPETLRVIDISLLPEHRGRGIGEGLLRSLLDDAAAAGTTLTIHVERQNRAMTLYRRLGFEEIEERGVYVLMEWRPAGAAEKK